MSTALACSHLSRILQLHVPALLKPCAHVSEACSPTHCTKDWSACCVLQLQSGLSLWHLTCKLCLLHINMGAICCTVRSQQYVKGVLLLQLLTGRVPDMGQVIAAKASAVAFSNTSLVQCDKTHLAAFNDVDALKTMSPLVTCQLATSARMCVHTSTWLLHRNWQVRRPFVGSFTQSSA